jgi:hypothetical protein
VGGTNFNNGLDKKPLFELTDRTKWCSEQNVGGVNDPGRRTGIEKT